MVERATTAEYSNRAHAPDVVIVLPNTDGEIGRVLVGIEELLLHLEDIETCEPMRRLRCAARQTIDAVGQMASGVREQERGQSRARPVARDDRFELVPLLFSEISRSELALILAALRELAECVASDEHRIVVEELGVGVGLAGRRADWVGVLRRLESLLQLPQDADVDLLHELLAPSVKSNGLPVRVVLAAAEYAAYRRVTDRIMSTWHQGDSLAAFLYRGLG